MVNKKFVDLQFLTVTATKVFYVQVYVLVDTSLQLLNFQHSLAFACGIIVANSDCF